MTKVNRPPGLCSGSARCGHPAAKAALAGSIWSFDALEPGAGWGEVLRVGTRQHATIHRLQILAAGPSNKVIRRRTGEGELTPLFSDVFAVNLLERDPLTAAVAALLHFRGDAVLSHLIAGYIFRILEELPKEIDVTLLGRSATPQTGVRVHRVISFPPADLTRRDGLPVTSIERTLIDLAACLTPIELESALAIALRRRLTTRVRILAAIERAPNRAGVSVLRSLLARDETLADTRSRYERKLLSMIRQAGLPAPDTNVMFEGYLADLLWRELRVVGEMDGFGVHGTRRQFEVDRARGARLTAANCRLVRVTRRHIDETPYQVVGWFAAAIALAQAHA